LNFSLPRKRKSLTFSPLLVFLLAHRCSGRSFFPQSGKGRCLSPRVSCPSSTYYPPLPPTANSLSLPFPLFSPNTGARGEPVDAFSAASRSLRYSGVFLLPWQQEAVLRSFLPPSREGARSWSDSRLSSPLCSAASASGASAARFRSEIRFDIAPPPDAPFPLDRRSVCPHLGFFPAPNAVCSQSPTCIARPGRISFFTFFARRFPWPVNLRLPPRSIWHPFLSPLPVGFPSRGCLPCVKLEDRILSVIRPE